MKTKYKKLANAGPESGIGSQEDGEEVKIGGFVEERKADELKFQYET